jgi:CDP-diacylglycerol--serine O-phosphatidyltransferase
VSGPLPAEPPPRPLPVRGFRRLRPRNRPRYKGPSFNRMIPNLLTMLGLCAGLTAMRFALEQRFGAAAAALAGGTAGWPAC